MWGAGISGTQCYLRLPDRLPRYERQIAGVVILGTMIINIGFFLFPVFLTVYGQEGISRLAAFDLGNSIVAHSYGFYLATVMETGRQLDSGAASNASLLSGFLGSTRRPGRKSNAGADPSFCARDARASGSGQHSSGHAHPWGFYPASLYKLATYGAHSRAAHRGGFLLGQALVLLTHLQGLDRVAVSMGSAMPTGLAVMVYSVSEGMDAEFAAGAISLSILVGLFVMPILLSLY